MRHGRPATAMSTHANLLVRPNAQNFFPPMRLGSLGRLRYRTYIHVAQCNATPSSSPPRSSREPPPNGWRTWWTVVDAGAWMGALGTAAAFVATQEALLIVGPLILPLVALYASKEKSSIDARQSQARVEQQFAKAVRQLVALSEEGTAEVAEEVASALQALESKGAGKEEVEAQQAVYAEKVLELTERVSAAVREGDEEVSSLVRRSTDAVGEGFKKLRSDIQGDLRSATSEEVAALTRLDARIESLEAALSGLDRSQSDGFRRLAASINAREGVEEEAIGEVVKAEVWRSLEPVRQLPQVLSGLNLALPGDVGDREALTEENIKKIMSIELDNLKKSLVMEQQDVLDEMSQWTAKVDSGQWNQLGAKLEELDEKLNGLMASRGEDSRQGADGGEGGGDMEHDVLSEMRDEVRGLTKDLEAIGEAMKSLSSGSSPTMLQAPSLPQQETLRQELQKALEGLYERQGQYESPDRFARELSGVVVDVLARVLGLRFESGPADPTSGVPITSWIEREDSDMDKVGVSNRPLGEVPARLGMSGSDMAEDLTIVEPAVAMDVNDTSDENVETAQNQSNADVQMDARIDAEGADGGHGELDEPDNASSSATLSSPYDRGTQILKDGRKAFSAKDYEQAETLLAQADACFAEAIEADPEDIRSVGNRGNTLMVRAKTRLMISAAKIESRTDVEGAQDDEEQAQEMLLQAGRLYRRILELEPAQGKAFVNWGRAICLRAEISQSAEDFEGAYSLFVNASDKFVAAMDSLPGSSAVDEAARLAAAALVGAYYCAGSLGLQDDALELLLEAESVLARRDEQASSIGLEIQEILSSLGR